MPKVTVRSQSRKEKRGETAILVLWLLSLLHPFLKESGMINQNSQNTIIIRRLKESDQVAVARIWYDGLWQTTSGFPYILQPAFVVARMFMSKSHISALREDGDIGPNGDNLDKSYGNKDDRCMFVAVQTGEPEKCVGCVVVKKGIDEKERQPESDVASIWRLSVDASSRKQGVGEQLMLVAESYAKTNLQCTSMRLITMNPIAATFYTKRMGYTSQGVLLDFGMWKYLVPPVVQFTKKL